MSGHHIDQEELAEVSRDIMITLDEDGDGDISKEEFIKHALKRNHLKHLCWTSNKSEQYFS